MDQATDRDSDQLDETVPSSDVEPMPSSDVETRPWWQSKLNLGVLALAIALLCGALGWVVGNNRAIPDPNRVRHRLPARHAHPSRAGRELEPLLPRARRARTPTIRDIAREIVFGQGIDIGRMIQLLRQFGATETNESDTAMTWMNQPTPIDRMPGLATDADIDKLLASKGADADKLFVS